MRSTVRVKDVSQPEIGPGRFTWDLLFAKTSEIITNASPVPSGKLQTDAGEFWFTDKTIIKLIPNKEPSTTFGLHPTVATVNSTTKEVIEVEFVMNAA
ncbi:hypothetical protein [Bdellovibrio sp. BCCA]|uniref:hypothetical protein n=1 Tax=Bdellovibrio sp. BCCA TaxID=3136281 RepID=UPI0030EFA982